jgi:nitroreductase
MELKATIEKRRTVRDFQNKKVPSEIIDYAIKNGFKAPSYNHLREWDFIILDSLEAKLKLIDTENLNKVIEIQELEEAFKNEEISKKEMYLDAIPKQKIMILNAPSVVIVVFKPKIRIEEAKNVYDLNCLASVWTCIENFLLSLAEHDVFAVTYIPQKNETLKEKLCIPSELEIASIIPIGYQSTNAKTLKQKNIDIAKHIHYEKW